MKIKLSKVWQILAVVATLMGAGGYFLNQQLIGDWLVAKTIGNSQRAPVPAKSDPKAVSQSPAQKILAEAKVSVGTSPWIEAEKKLYLAILTNAKPELVVLPFQIPEGKNQFGIDLAARMVMAYMTAQRIESGTARKVADVELVARAIGEPRHLTRADAIQFGRAVGAKTIVYGESSHDGKGQLTVAVAAISVTAPADAKGSSKTGLEISDAITPELSYRRAVDEIVGQLGFDDSKPVESKMYAASTKPFPDPPLPTTDSGDTPVDGIWMQELIGSLFPYETLRARARVFERALAAMDYLSPASPDYRLLQARALMYLGRRPAALATITDAVTTPEERAFLAYLNGNVPETEKAIAQIKRPLPKLIAELELAWLRSAGYEVDNDKLPQFAERLAKNAPKAWAPTIVWNVMSQDLWNLRPTMEVKLVMDTHFPVLGYSADEVVRGKTVAGSPADPKVALEIEGAPLAHAGKALAQYGKDWCCNPQSWKPRPYQYLDLLAAHAEGMLLRAVDHTAYIQGQRENALQMIDIIDEVVFQRGSLALSLRKARLLNALAKESPSPDRQAAFAVQLYQAAKRFRQWNMADAALVTEAMRYESTGASRQFALMLKNPALKYPDLNDFKHDFPPTGDYLYLTHEYTSSARGDEKDLMILEKTCAYVLWTPEPCGAWRARLDATNQTEAARKVEQEQLVNRFHGSRTRIDILVGILKEREDISGAVALARENIQIAREDWKGYQTLGSLYLYEGNFKAATDAYLSYPPYRNSGNRNTVELSNLAGGAAYQLARRGSIKGARPLYEIAARFDNGSDGSIGSALALAYIDGRFGDATAISLARVQRYGMGHAMRAYLSLLFALDDSKTGWAATREALGRQAAFSVWRAVPVGFRRDGTNADEIRKWAKENAQLEKHIGPATTSQQALHAMTIVIQTLAVDRTVASIEAIPGISKELFAERKSNEIDLDKIPPESREAFKKIMEESRIRVEKADRERPGFWNEYLDRLITGYLALKRGDYKASWDEFQRRPEPGRFDGAVEASHTALPYHAYAAVKAGQTDAFVLYLERYSKYVEGTPQQRSVSSFSGFDIALARAILATSQGKHDEARKQLLFAQGRIEEPGTRPLPPEYVFAEVCEMLGADSGQRAYLDMGIEWAKAYQAYEPWSAWAYAFEARHGKTDADRVRALAITQYLDKHSARIAGIDVKLANQAKAWIAANKPFPRERRSPIRTAL